MKLLVDESLSPAWALLLVHSGFDAVHWHQLGPGNAPDPEIMSYAVEHGYAILTHDLDFGINLSRSKFIAPSVIQVRTHDTNPHVIGEQVVQAIKSALKELASGALITVDARNRQRLRLTVLPIEKEE